MSERLYGKHGVTRYELADVLRDSSARHLADRVERGSDLTAHDAMRVKDELRRQSYRENFDFELRQ